MKICQKITEVIRRNRKNEKLKEWQRAENNGRIGLKEK